MTVCTSHEMKQLFSYIDENSPKFIELLSEAVSIPSISAEPARRPDVIRMAQWAATKLRKLGATVKLEKIGTQQCADGSTIDLPPLVLAQLGNDPQKKTVFIYGHLDVQPADKSDGWDTEPFDLVNKDGKLYGRGSTDDKGPVLGWFNAIQSFQDLNMEIPVNLQFCLEGMEESGSEGLEEYLLNNSEIFKNVDYICISDNYWIGTKTPCVTVGLRGLAYFFVEIECSDRDLHSGAFGGTVYEAMTELTQILATLVTNTGRIQIAGIYDDVLKCTEEEKSFYEKIKEFNLEDYRKEAGVFKVVQNTAAEALMARSRYPCLSIHGIEGAFSGVGAKTVIPKGAIGKFSIRLVPDQDPAKIEAQVKKHILNEFKKLNSPNKISVSMHHGGKPWYTDVKGAHAQAAVTAIKSVYGMEPYFTKEGGSIPITLTFESISKKSVLLLPMGASDDGEHSQNEKINIYNYINGTKTFCAYLNEIAKI